MVKAWNQTVQYVGEYLQAKAKQWRAEAPIKPVVAIVDDAAAITALVAGTRIIVASLSALLVKKGVDDQLAKEVHKNKDAAAAPQTQSKASSSSSGAIPPDGWEPKEGRSKEKKEVTYPNNPHRDGKSFKPISRTKAKESLQDGSIWEKDMSKHGGEQWKMWKTRRSWEKSEEPASIWPDGRVRKWGDQ